MTLSKNGKIIGAVALVVVAIGAIAYSSNATSSPKGFANFESADKNGDGAIDRAEFASFLKSNVAASACAKGGKAGGCSGGGCEGKGKAGGCSGGGCEGKGMAGGCSGGGCEGGAGGCSGGGCGGHGNATPEVPAPEAPAAPAAPEAAPAE